MPNWYIDLNGSGATGANSISNPYSADQFFDLLQGTSVNGYVAATADIFYLKGYYYNTSLVRDTLLSVSVVSWDLLRYGPWVIDSPLDFGMGTVEFSGGVINLNAPDLCAISNLVNVMVIAQNTDSKFTLNGTYSKGCTIITRGTVGSVINSGTYQFKDCTIINENPLESNVSTILNIDNCLINLVDGTGSSEFFGGSNISKGYSTASQYGWTAPVYTRLPFTGNTPSVRNVSTLMSESILIAPQGISALVPNYTASAITAELSTGDHDGYEQGLQGELRTIDDGSVDNRKYVSNGIGAWWFSQEDLEIDDTKSSSEEGIFVTYGGGSFLKKVSDQNSAYIRSGSVYKNTSTFPDINDYSRSYPLEEKDPGLLNRYFSQSNFLSWVRNADIGVKLWELTNSTGSITYSKIEVTDTDEITITARLAELEDPDSEVAVRDPEGYTFGELTVNLGVDISGLNWHLVSVIVNYSNWINVYVDKTLLLFPVKNDRYSNWNLTSTGTNYRIYMPRVESFGKTVEVSKPRYSVTQTPLTSQVVSSIYDLELGELPV